MRNRNTIYSFAVVIVIAGSFLAMWAASPAATGRNNPCKETMDPCCKKGIKSNTSTWETLPQRFFSSLSL